jgi:hypothetical protein
VVDYRNIRTETNTEAEMRCTADALLNTSVTRPVAYVFTVFTEENGQVFVRFKLARLRGLEGFSSARSLSINELTEKVFTTEVSRTSRR